MHRTRVASFLGSATSLLSAPIAVALFASACAGNEGAQPGTPTTPAVAASASPAREGGPPSGTSLLMPAAFAYPATRLDAQKDAMFGTEVRDPYRWLEDGKSDEVKAWMKAEDDFARARLAALPERDAIAARLKELFYIEAQSTPHHFGHRYFWAHRDPQAEKWVIFSKEGKKGEPKVLLDPNAWSADGSSSLGSWSPSWDGKRVAYSVKVNNSDEATLFVIDVATGKKSAVDVIEGAKYARPTWTPSGDGFYYTWLPSDPKIPVAERPGYSEIRFHKLGTDPKTDAVVHEKLGDAKSFLVANLSRDGRWLFATIEHGWSKSDIFVQDLRSTPAAGGTRKWLPLTTGRDAMFDVVAHKGSFYVHTNDGAPTWRIFRVDPAHMEQTQWKEIVSERKDATLHDFSIVGGKLSLAYMKDVVTELELRDLDGKLVRHVNLPGLGSAGAFSGEPDEDEAYYSYDSFTEPLTIFETSVASGKTTEWYKLKVPVDASKYVVEQLRFASKDGTQVPMFVIHGKDMTKDGTAPTILYGYGGFQSAQTPGFRTSFFPWLERGGVYAIANLRGGNEYGEEWHRQGMGRKKQNVFDDFVAAGEALIKAGYTKASSLVARGGSNGGLLVGAAMTQRPDLFRVVLCGVPLLDMVRYHLFGSGKTWVSEYGSSEDADDFKALYAYSPYHHVKPGTKYPSVLLLSADSDDRVDPLHARKFAAELQRSSTGGVVLLRIEKNSGHGGADLVKASVVKLADEYAFALSEIAKPL